MFVGVRLHCSSIYYKVGTGEWQLSETYSVESIWLHFIDLFDITDDEACFLKDIHTIIDL